MLSKVIHKWLSIPYTLHVRYVQRPKKPVATYIFLHGIGNTGEAWDDVIRQLPANVRIITLDLLGFGESPKPAWAKYNAKTQARSVIATILSLRIVGSVTLVGHSLGALTAIEVAKNYAILVSKLVLCSPPLYLPDNYPRKLPFKSDQILKQLYRSAIMRPEQFVALADFATRYNLVNKSFRVTQENLHSYMTALEAMVINQTSFDDARKLTIPTHIIEGSLDPFVIHSNLKKLTKENPNVKLQVIFAGHEIRGLFTKAVVKHLQKDLTSDLKMRNKPIAQSKAKNKV